MAKTITTKKILKGKEGTEKVTTFYLTPSHSPEIELAKSDLSDLASLL